MDWFGSEFLWQVDYTDGSERTSLWADSATIAQLLIYECLIISLDDTVRATPVYATQLYAQPTAFGWVALLFLDNGYSGHDDNYHNMV